MGFTKPGSVAMGGPARLGGVAFMAGGFTAGAFAAVLLWTGVIGSVRPAGAGPLDPPEGPVASTFKTLVDVEPRTAINQANTPGDADSLFRITQPGSYYLTGNITGVAGKSGIEIAASNVTLDLNGFAMSGVAGSLDGVRSEVGSGVTVLNGFLSGWRSGIDALASQHARVEGVTSLNNTAEGIRLGDYAIARRCIVSLNAANGLSVSVGGLIESCIARQNTLDGIVSGALGSVVRCDARSNRGAGIRSSANGYALIAECTVAENFGDGIRVNSGVTVARNVVSFNGPSAGAGIRATGSDNRIEENSCTNNSRGIEVAGSGNFIARNIVTGSGANNWSIAANNVVLVVVANNAAAFSGFSGGTAPGSTDPNANFSY